MGKFKVINLSKALKIDPQKAIRFLKKDLGDKVFIGDLLASKKRLLGKTKKIYASVDGILEKLEESTGKLIIKEFDKQKKKVEKSFDDAKDKIEAILGFGKAQGVLTHLAKDLGLRNLKSDFRNKIIVCNKVRSKGVLYKASALGVKGLILKEIKTGWFEELKQASFDLNLKLPVIVLGDNIEKLQKYNLVNVICDGDNKIIIIT